MTACLKAFGTSFELEIHLQAHLDVSTSAPSASTTAPQSESSQASRCLCGFLLRQLCCLHLILNLIRLSDFISGAPDYDEMPEAWPRLAVTALFSLSLMLHRRLLEAITGQLIAKDVQ
jgi:hypothetical protein